MALDSTREKASYCIQMSGAVNLVHILSRKSGTVKRVKHDFGLKICN